MNIYDLGPNQSARKEAAELMSLELNRGLNRTDNGELAVAYIVALADRIKQEQMEVLVRDAERPL